MAFFTGFREAAFFAGFREAALRGLAALAVFRAAFLTGFFAALRGAAFRAALFGEAFRAGFFLADFFGELFFTCFFFFMLSPPQPRRAGPYPRDHNKIFAARGRPYNAAVKKRASRRSRILLESGPNGLRIEIAPPVSSPRFRRRALPAAVLFAVGTVAALLRLSSQWQQAARGGGAGLPAGLLAGLTLAVLAGAPLAAVGLLSLLFAEETIELDREEFRHELTVFARSRRRRVPRNPPLELRWTSRPISPWWTWTFVRLAIVSRRERFGLGATLGVAEKKRLFEILRAAFG